MAQEQNQVEQAVSRALRENLERIQRTADELHQAVNDVVAACASTRPTNSLPPMLRAQTAAAALMASLDVLSRFVSMSMQAGYRSPLEAEMMRLVSMPMSQPAAELGPSMEPPRQPIPVPMAAAPVQGAAAPMPAAEPPPMMEGEIPAAEGVPESEAGFDMNRLSSEERELHRRANRVAKVSMQDIKMLRPEQVRLGRENKDLCSRLQDDIEKAHREYDRRFKPIMAHPVDYFYHWMVQILAEGDPKALGEYPYGAPAHHS